MKKISIALLALALAACGNNGKYKVEIQKVDSLQNQLSLYHARLDSVDQERLREMQPEINELYDYLTENYPDSLDRRFWINTLNQMVIVKKGTERYLANYEQLKGEMDYTGKQLADLENSLKDEKLESEKVQEYLRDEKQAVVEIEFFVNKLHGPARYAISAWDTLHPQMQSLADSLRALP